MSQDAVRAFRRRSTAKKEEEPVATVDAPTKSKDTTSEQKKEFTVEMHHSRIDFAKTGDNLDRSSWTCRQPTGSHDFRSQALGLLLKSSAFQHKGERLNNTLFMMCISVYVYIYIYINKCVCIYIYVFMYIHMKNNTLIILGCPVSCT